MSTTEQWAVDCTGRTGEEDLCIHTSYEDADACLTSIEDNYVEEIPEWDTPPRLVTRDDLDDPWRPVK